MRISLYPHELAMVERLTAELIRLRLAKGDGGEDYVVEISGPKIFAALVDALYARGNWSHTGKRFEYAPTVKLPDGFDFAEVRGATP